MCNFSIWKLPFKTVKTAIIKIKDMKENFSNPNGENQ